MPKVVTPRQFGKPLGLYSHGMLAPGGEILVVAGQVGVGREGRVDSDVGAQTRQALENVRAVLEAGGCRWRDVVRLRTNYRGEDVYVYPPNTLLVVSRLVRPELRVEIEAMAVRPRPVARRQPAPRRKSRR